MCEQRGLRYRLRAEVDDMAMLRLLARDSDSVALLPTVVVQDELRIGQLVEYGQIYPQIEGHPGDSQATSAGRHGRRMNRESQEPSMHLSACRT